MDIRLKTVTNRINLATNQSDRLINSVQLIAVSKTFPSSQIKKLYDLGIRDFAENYIQEWIEKVTQLPQDVIWHIIGPIQSNKTRLVAENAQWVHSIDRLKIAQRLSQQRPEHLPDLNVCIEVNISKEAQKHGIAAENLLELATIVSELPKLTLRGLMCVPSSENIEIINNEMQQMHQLWLSLQQQGFDLDVLSMGMSADLEIAIANGATHVRIGSALFGQRDYNK